MIRARPAEVPIARIRPDPWTLTLGPDAALAWACLAMLLHIHLLGGVGALAFLVAGALLVARRLWSNMEMIARSWWILLLPAWCALSTVWSAYPAETLRASVQFGLTVAVAIAIAARVPPRRFLHVLFAALALATLTSLTIGRARLDGGGYLGIYGSKNAFAQVMALFLLCGLALALGRDGARGWRIAGLASLPVSLILLVMAQSAGWLVAGLATVGIGLTFAVLRRIRPGLRLPLISLALLAVVTAVLATLAGGLDVGGAFLTATGKDVTLTGRTDLWATALAEIARAPWIGQGYKAVWVQGSPVAEALWEQFGIASRTGFNFHNTWLSNMVEVGALGIGLQALIFACALLASLLAVLRAAAAATLFWAMLMLQMTVMSAAEVVAFAPFELSTTLVLVAAARIATRPRSTRRARHQSIRAVAPGNPSAGTIPARVASSGSATVSRSPDRSGVSGMATTGSSTAPAR